MNVDLRGFNLEGTDRIRPMLYAMAAGMEPFKCQIMQVDYETDIDYGTYKFNFRMRFKNFELTHVIKADRDEVLHDRWQQRATEELFWAFRNLAERKAIPDNIELGEN